MADNLEKQLEDFVISNKEYFYRLAYSYVKNNDDALDVVQECGMSLLLDWKV